MKVRFPSYFENFAKMLLLVVVVLAIAQCNTSNKVASSFAKRKYTPGRYLDPNATTNGDYAPAGSSKDVQANRRMRIQERSQFKSPQQILGQEGQKRTPCLIFLLL